MSQLNRDPGETTRAHFSSGTDSPWHSTGAARFDLLAAFEGKASLLIGRNPASDIWLEHPAVSRTHAALRQGPDGSLLVRDLNSTHGITLDGKPVQGEACWRPGTVLHLGPQALWFEDGKNPCIKPLGGTPDLVATGLTVRVLDREKPILDHVSFTLKPGEFICVLGPSGAGKSTLVKCLQGLQSADGGRLVFGGSPIHANPAILNGLVGYVPQQMSLHETLTVGQVVHFAARLRLPSDTSPKEMGEHVDRALRSMGIERLVDQRISSLSGGERKRVELASELVVDPAILLVDEATSSLDPASEARVMEVLARTAKQGKLVLCVTHHLDNIAKADKILILAEGKLVYLGPPGGACIHFGVDNLPDAFVRLEDEGADKWTIPFAQKAALPPQACQPASGLGGQFPRRGFAGRLRETMRQTAILTSREFAAAWSDRRYLFLAALMPALFALVVIACHWLVDFSRPILLTRDLNEDEKSSFAVFWPVIHDAARGNLGESENLSVRAQLAFLLENKPRMRESLGREDLNRIVTGAIEGKENVFPDKIIKNPLTTHMYLAVQMMGLSFMGMLLGLTIMVRDGAIFPREKAAGLSPLSYLISKVILLVLATGFQTLVFDGILEGLFLARRSLTGMEAVPVDYRISLAPMLLVHWLATLGCACLGLLLGALTRKTDRAIILLGAMMLPQLTLGSALGLAATPIPKAVACITSPTYWGFRGSQLTPMENDLVLLPPFLRIFGDSFIQSVPLALAGLAAQISLYLALGWWLLRSKASATE